MTSPTSNLILLENISLAADAQHLPPPAGSARRIPSLDGLRGIAILVVFLHHYFEPTHSCFPGWAGVDLFFVLSGYLITGRLLATKGRPNYFSHFYRNRALRIFPLYYGLIIPFFLAAWLLVRPVNQPHFTYYLQHWKSFFLFTQNWTFIFYGFPRNATLIPLWSLGVEEQFYLFWPLVILLTRDSATRLKLFSAGILLVLVLRTILYVSHPSGSLAGYYNTFLRMDSLMAGSLLCQLHRNASTIRRSWVLAGIAASLALIVLSFIITGNVDSSNPFFGTVGYTVLAALFAGILHLAVQPGNSRLKAFLSMGFLRFCGRISYCLYLIHVPVIIIIGSWISINGARRWPEHALLARWTALSVSIILSFGLSALSYRYFEPIFQRLKKESATSSGTSSHTRY